MTLPSSRNRRFPEITGEDNLTVVSYSRRVKSPEWRRQRRRADLRHFEIFSHGPIIIYIRLPAGGTYYPICPFPASSERLIGISDAFSAFCLRVSVIFPTCSLYSPTKACLLCATLAGMDLYIQVHARMLLPSAVPWISEDRLLVKHYCPSLIQNHSGSDRQCSIKYKSETERGPERSYRNNTQGR